MTGPVVAIVIPVYNKASTVGRSIKSARKQTFTDIEIVVVNDGSTDGSEAEILKAIGDDPRCKYVKQENAGVANARNNGVFNHSTAPYIICLDSDDAIQAGYVQGLLSAISENRRIGVAYTRLISVTPDGNVNLSPWPANYDGDRQFAGANQIPTAAMVRRTVWKRLGGQRQRFAPLGAGAEDADFWFRAMSYGFQAKYAPLENGSWFVYSWLSGMVSGNKDYREVDYRAWSPWARDKSLMPTPASFKPKDFSHDARWYDEPFVSVIIPVSSGHVDMLDNALDSLDAQTHKHFETIVVFDVTPDAWEEYSQTNRLHYIANTWPACHFTSVAANGKTARELTSKIEADKQGVCILDKLPQAASSSGPAVARNAGLKLARAPLILFLDADDWLDPTALEKMLAVFRETGNIVYTDHIGIAEIKERDLNRVDGKVLAYDKKKGMAYIHQTVTDYDCPEALKQPVLDGRPPYVICNVSALVPKKWVMDAGMFDTTLDSWEDVLLWWKLAWAGKCFSRIPEPLLIYRYTTGSMRQTGFDHARELLQKLRAISDGITKMGCNCGKNKQILVDRREASMATSTATGGVELKLSRGGTINVSDNDLVLIELQPRSEGSLPRYGGNDFGGGQIFYGYRTKGDRFLVHKRDYDTELAMATAQHRQPEFVSIQEARPKVDEDKQKPPQAPVDFSAARDIWSELLDEEEESLESSESFPVAETEKTESSEIFPEPSGHKRIASLSDLDVDLQNKDYYVGVFERNGITDVLELLNYEEEYKDADGLASIPRIGPKVREAFLAAAQKHLYGSD